MSIISPYAQHTYKRDNLKKNSRGFLYVYVINKIFFDQRFPHAINTFPAWLRRSRTIGKPRPIWAMYAIGRGLPSNNRTPLQLAGASYMEVHQAGGGIHFTVEHTRKASKDELYASFSQRLYDMMSAGTTCVECKSGYGLDTETEIKMLKVIETAKREHPLTISSTFCGAHAIPKYEQISW